MEQAKIKRYWFARKTYGWGWGLPLTWEGWIVFAVYFTILIKLFRQIDAVQHSGSDALIDFAPRFIAATLVFILICYWKGEPPKWSWGKDK